jgi:nucleotide-binding universal stress UspA family protein
MTLTAYLIKLSPYMLKIRNILYPTDFSDNSKEALKYATHLAELYNSQLHIVHVALGPNVVITYSMTRYTPEVMMQRERRSLEKTLSKLPPKKLGTPRSVIHRVVEGIPVPEIHRYIKGNQIDMVVMGTHGHTGFKHLVLGSVAENVVRESKVPVLTVHSRQH